MRNFMNAVEQWVDDDNFLICFGKLCVVLIVATALLLSPFITYSIWQENAHPCNEWSELRPVTHYVMSGKIMVPVQRMEHECVGRQ